jgi:hypothetical protein
VKSLPTRFPGVASDRRVSKDVSNELSLLTNRSSLTTGDRKRMPIAIASMFCRAALPAANPEMAFAWQFRPAPSKLQDETDQTPTI